MSRAVAPPMLTIKPACFSLTCAPPTVRPRRPQSSMSLAAKCPSGRLNVLPALGNEFIVLIKETSVAGYIALQDLTKAGDIIRGRTFSAFMPLFAVALIYLAMVMIFTAFVNRLERRLRSSEH